jgi:hypothetical protein
MGWIDGNGRTGERERQKPKTKAERIKKSFLINSMVMKTRVKQKDKQRGEREASVKRRNGNKAIKINQIVK